ncbi:MAG: TlyA family RNA methyltransferase [Oscillospiraceae bacterium]
MRADVFLAQEGFFETRQKAQKAILSQCVMVNNKIIKKSSFIINQSDKIEINQSICQDLKFVSRGGLKLEKALQVFNINLNGLICGDFGASTGGFCDCMLYYGCKNVFAIDVGKDQLHPKIALNPKIINIEKTNIKTMDSSVINTLLDFIATDVSFISLEHILPKISENLKNDCFCVCLIKPQFETEKSNLNKKGIVKDFKIHKAVILKIISLSILNCLSPLKIEKSPIKGGDGNTEHLILLQKSINPQTKISNDDIKNVLNS